MAMSNSFYGGRRGASFVIVKNYLDIPSMTKDFAQGNSFKDVAFDEYVLINNPNKNHPDNGKIFRRGYDFNSNKTISGYVLVDEQNHTIVISSDSESYEAALGDGNHTFQPINDIQAHGAEYIGSIVGPAGKAPLLTLSSYEYVQNKHAAEGFEERSGSGSYSPNGENPGLIPGKDSNGNFHDSIEWRYVSVRNDNYGDDTQAYIGFKFPYLVTQMSTQQVSPYDENGNIADKSNIARANDDPGTHPYYNKWHLSIPKGVSGDALRNLRVTYFNKYAENADNSNEKRSPLYYCIRSQGQTIEKELIYPGINENESRFDRQFFKTKYGTGIVSEGITLNELLDRLAGKAIYVYEKYNFDNKQNGEVKYYYLGDCNEIESIELSEEGKLSYVLTHDGEKELTPNLKWIKDIELTLPFNEIEIEGESDEFGDPLSGNKIIEWKDEEPENNFKIIYNTKDEFSQPEEVEFNIPYVKRILYHNGTLGYQLAGKHNGDEDSETLEWIPLTDIRYINGVEYQNNDISSLRFLYNTYNPLDNSSKDANSIVVNIPVVSHISIDKDNQGVPALVVHYTNNQETNQLAKPFLYLESFNYDSTTGTLSFKRNDDTTTQNHVLNFVNGLEYDRNTAQLQYKINGSNDTIAIGNVPLIKNMEVDDDTKAVMVQFGSKFPIPAGATNIVEKNDNWYQIGTLISEKVVVGGIVTNYTRQKLSSAIAKEEGLDSDIKTTLQNEINSYSGIGDFSTENNPIIQALNILHPNGITDNSAELKVVTFGEDNDDKQYYGFDWLPAREIEEDTYGGTWYYLGQVTAISNVAFDSEGTDIVTDGILFIRDNDICTIQVNDSTSQCAFSNPITKIQKNHKYVNVISKPSSLNITVDVSIEGNSLNNVYDSTINRIQIPAERVTGNIQVNVS